MSSGRATQLAMPIAGLMIAHQVAAKAVRDATFLGAWPTSALPVIVVTAAVLVVAVVPIYSRLLERFGPRRVVSIGFVLSALGHAAEWQTGAGRWVAVVVYLHVAGFSGLLLSGFWSLVSELFDPRSARARFGKIAAVGTVGGLVGGLAAAAFGAGAHPGAALLLLAGLHALCAIGVFALGTGVDTTLASAASTEERDTRGSLLDRSVLGVAPHLRTLALVVVLGSASAVMLDYLLKAHAVARVGTGPELLRFFATFYVVVQVATFLAQFGVNACVNRFGLGRTVSALPAGVATLGTLNLLYPTFPLIVLGRGTEFVLRGSLFRSAYELVFVPMTPRDKRRAKTFLDVTCDRAGDALGAGIVQALFLTSAIYLPAELLAAAIAMSAGSLWLGRRLDALYLNVVERRLAAHGDPTPVVVASETGWTILDLPRPDRLQGATTTAAAPPAAATAASRDPVISRLMELRSGDRHRVAQALDGLASPSSIEVAAVIQLLAWNDLVPRARKVLSGVVDAHIGVLSDALLNPDTDFAIRRRIPRILGTVASARVVPSLLAGLEDSRFEVRYQCSAALRRVLTRNASVGVDRVRILAVLERELSVPLQVWQGHRLIDVDREDEGATPDIPVDRNQRNVEHVYSLLSTVLPQDTLRVAFQGLRSDDTMLKGVAIEYFDGALPRHVWSDLVRLLDARLTPSSSDAPGQSDPPPRATPR